MGTQGGGQQSDGGGLAHDSRQNQYGTITRVLLGPVAEAETILPPALPSLRGKEIGGS